MSCNFKLLNYPIPRLQIPLALFVLIISASAQDLVKVQSPAPSASSSTFLSGGVTPIGPGDLLEISVFDTPELSGKVRVSNSGDVSLPLIGALHVAGLTSDEMQARIANKLVDGQLVKDPQVTVFMAEYATQGVSVLGEVKRPGIYPALGQHRLLDYISLGEGLTPLAGVNVTITPRADPEALTMVRLSSKSSPTAAENPAIAPGDTIFVSKAGIVYVVGDVAKPGGFIMEHDEHLTVLQALALAQGTNSTAAKSHARIIRKRPDGHEEIPLDLGKILSAKTRDVPLQDDDIIFVPTSAAKGGLKSVSSVIASVAAAAIYHF